MTETLETRLAALEAESAIRKLKYIYLNACDSKDVETIKACFTEDAELDYPPIGKFGLDGLIDISTHCGCADDPLYLYNFSSLVL